MLVCATKDAWSMTTNHDPGKPCKLPFIYKGTSYNKCTDVDKGFHWCATKVDSENHFDTNSNDWGECNDYCRKSGN